MAKLQAAEVEQSESYVQRKLRAWADQGSGLSVAPRASRPPLFQAAWSTVNVLLILWVLVATYSIAWEYSTRRYLKGFSDAIVPTAAAPQAKVQAILNWMAHGPSRSDMALQPGSPDDRNPTDTLNYASLMKVCGSATNAFLNLADSAGVPARRLLLLDSRSVTKHVVAEVLIDGRWIVVDPTFRAIFQSGGNYLTSIELQNPGTYQAAIKAIPKYDPSYTFEKVAHVHLAHVPLVGGMLSRLTSRFFPQWENWTWVSLVLERESLEATLVAISLVFFLNFIRIILRYYGETRLGIRSIRLRHQMLRALHAFVQATA